VSRLYLSERGHVIPTLGEELTTYRRARKVLRLPRTDAPGTAYVLARPNREDGLPLRVAVNGAEVDPVLPNGTGVYQWFEVPVDPSGLREGDNTFELWTDATAMDAWAVALEAGHADPNSWISDDAGSTWRNESMAYLNAVGGEYVVRVRLAEGDDSPPPRLVWEEADNPRLASLYRKLPTEARQGGQSRLDQVRALTAWLASSWEHTGSGRAAQYAPWDAETIIAWGGAQCGHNGKRPITMCVHYAVALVSCCQALGMPARCAVLTGTPNGFDGHFVTEVWFEEYDRWVMVDPNADAICFADGEPLSIPQIQRLGSEVCNAIEYGEGAAFQRTFPHMVEFLRDNLEEGVCFRHRRSCRHPATARHPIARRVWCGRGITWSGVSACSRTSGTPRISKGPRRAAVGVIPSVRIGSARHLRYGRRPSFPCRRRWR